MAEQIEFRIERRLLGYWVFAPMTGGISVYFGVKKLLGLSKVYVTPDRIVFKSRKGRTYVDLADIARVDVGLSRLFGDTVRIRFNDSQKDVTLQHVKGGGELADRIMDLSRAAARRRAQPAVTVRHEVGTATSPSPDALSILRERYARGEISKDEYEERKNVLGP